MNPDPSSWHRLAAAARRAPEDRDAAAPYGFAVRVAARARAARSESGLALAGRFSLRAMGLAGALAVAAVAANLPSVRQWLSQGTQTAGASAAIAAPASTDDPTAELVELASS